MVSTMWKLDKPDGSIKKEYVAKLLPGLAERIAHGVGSAPNHFELSDAAKDVLLPNWSNTDSKLWNTERLKRLLIDEPASLVSLEKEIIAEFGRITNAVDRPDNNILKHVFNYDGVFNDSTKEKAYWLAKKVGRNTCVYCNRQYVFTVEKGDGLKKNERITRPVFDHWFAKSEHPLLSLSLFNLIPSCTICNSSVKGQTSYSLETHIHPYVHRQGQPDITFKVSAAATPKLKWKVKLDSNRKKEQKTKNDLALDEIYTMHGALEVNDLMEFKQKYPDGYLNQLVNDVLKDVMPGQHLTKSDVYRMLFGVEATEDKFLDRPLSKLKYDILHDMGVI